MKIAYCIKCGNKFPEEAVFCPYCGTKIFRQDDEKTDIKPEEVIVNIPDEPVAAEPVSLQETQVEINYPKTEDVVRSVTPITTESVIKEDKSDEEASPVQDKVNVSETETISEKDDAKAVSIEPNTLVDEEELEDPKIGVCILAFFFPIVGFIAAGSNRRTNKKKSKTYAMWAWIGFGLSFITKMLSATI